MMFNIWTYYAYGFIIYLAVGLVLELLAYFTGSVMLTGWMRTRTDQYPFLPIVIVLATGAVYVHFWLERYGK